MFSKQYLLAVFLIISITYSQPSNNITEDTTKTPVDQEVATEVIEDTITQTNENVSSETIEDTTTQIIEDLVTEDSDIEVINDSYETEESNPEPKPESSNSVVIGNEEKKPDIISRVKNDLISAHLNVKKGSSVYFAGLAIDYCVLLPMQITAGITRNNGLAIGSMVGGIITTGMKISGPIRCGVGASMMYDSYRLTGISTSKPKHWVYYQIGWTFSAIGSVINVASTLSASVGDNQVPVALSFVSLGLGLASEIMWISSCTSAIKYSKKIRSNVGLSSLQIRPYYNANKEAGAKLSMNF